VKHLVTGGSGFLGNLIARRLLARGERVAILRDPQGADLGLVENAAPNPES